MTAHYVYVLRGWLTFRFAGVEGDVTLRAGDGLSQPAGVPHNVIARSDDLEVIEINEPAEYGTWNLAGAAGAVASDARAAAARSSPGCARAAARSRSSCCCSSCGKSAVRLTGVKEYLLPPPSKVWTEFWKRHDIVAGGAWVTTQEILAGYALAVVVSIPLALAVAYSRFMEQAVYPVIVFLQIVPKIAIAPLFIIWFGFGFMPKLLLVFLLSFFPIVVSSIAGFKSADRDVMDFARTTGAGGLRACSCKIRLPQALPHIFTGLKVGAALAATAAVVAEFVASDRGLGYLLLQYNGQLDTPMVFATIVILSLIGLVVYYAVEIVERLAIPWHVSQQAHGQGRDAVTCIEPARDDATTSPRRNHEDSHASPRSCAAAVALGAASLAHRAGQGVAAPQLVPGRPARAVLLRQGQGLLRRRRHRPHDQRRPRLGQHGAGRRRGLGHVRPRRLVVGRA